MTNLPTQRQIADGLIRCVVLLGLSGPREPEGRATPRHIPISLLLRLERRLTEEFGAAVPPALHTAVLELIDCAEAINRPAYYMPDVAPGESNHQLPWLPEAKERQD